MTEPTQAPLSAGHPAVETATESAVAVEVMHLRLYVAGMSPKSLEAFANLKQLCEAHLETPYEIEIVDLIEHPSLARGDDIIAVPTVVKDVPAPMRKVIGDLSDTERVLLGLQLISKQS